MFSHLTTAYETDQAGVIYVLSNFLYCGKYKTRVSEFIALNRCLDCADSKAVHTLKLNLKQQRL